LHTILDKSLSQLILFLHQSQVQGSTISDLVIDIIQTSREQNLHTPLDLWVLLSNAELGKRRDGCGAHNGVLQHHSVVDVTNILGRLGCLRSLETKEVEDSDGKLGELAVLNELA
jgi:hypothetical protein